MLKYIARRLVFMAFLLIGVSVIVFIITHMVPANPAVAYLGTAGASDPEVVAAFNARWGLDQPLYKQYLLYLGGLLRGDMGTSLRTGHPVLDDLMQYFPATIELSVFAILLAGLFGILFGVVSAMRPDTLTDQLLRGVSVTGVSLPSFWLSLVMLYLFYYQLKWLPGPGRVSARLDFTPGPTQLYLIDALIQGNFTAFKDALSHLVLPGLVLSAFSMGLIARTTRSSLMDVMSQDYVRTARSKGLSRPRVVMRHAFGGAMMPVVTVLGMSCCSLLGGVVLVEKIFQWPGIGQYAYLAATKLDFPAITGVSLLIASIYVVLNLLIDILYALINPKVRY